MDIKTSVKLRREARIRELLDERYPEAKEEPANLRSLPVSSAVHKPVAHESSLHHSSPDNSDVERDPEEMWKKGHRGWYDHFTEPELPPRKFTFVSGLLRRLAASVVVFGTVWGLFFIHEPWAMRVQGYILDGLSREMNFHAAQMWYEEHFGGTPSFIPIFDQSEQSTTKVNAGTSLVPPIKGHLVQSFAVDLKGILIAPKGVSRKLHEVKSVEAGRVLEIKKQVDSSVTVLIQHTGTRTAVYGRLFGTSLKVNDWVEGGDVVGTLPLAASNEEQPALYFMLKDGERSVDPMEVISFD
ncbi:M23 family metallopeptidase [Paenibacillus dakarensis]|uniref:M23 family metallopeptidase n=1 Tax=Paenibacillus dakarensis TaxID=1527293 RepID=UPI0006D5953A|nr:M23 family metallopeptidase [Paenibacillus dakarensis]